MKKILPLLAVLVLAFVATPEVNAQIQPGNCTLGVASADLNVNNVRARLFNNGGLFWLGGDPIYTVPKNGDANAIFASGIWIGGEVNGELRLAAATYSGHEFFPGPLDEDGRPPADCSEYDQIYVVTAEDVQNYNATGETTPNLVNWPHDLGAPVIDGDGNPNNYNLAGGDRPEIIGDQTAWWVMNDVGGAHKFTSPIGLEVQVTAFAFRRADALNNATFYRYNIIYEGNEPLTNAFMTLWSDPDLGNAGDDFIGTDTSRGIGFVYNGDNFDDTGAGYGTPPPALGYDFFQGPLVADNGVDDDGDGEVDEDDERLDMTIFGYYNNNNTDQGNPGTAEEYFNYMTGHWKTGERWTVGGTGIGGTEETNFIYPGDPVTQSYWSEEDTDPAEGIQKGEPGDRRFVMSTGPFVIQPGDEQEIVFGIVWAQGGDRLGSVTAMRNADVLAQNAFDLEFQLPDPPAAPDVTASSFDNTAVLTWGYQPNANNYLESYEVVDPFLVGTGVPDSTYTFEGYKIFRYNSQTFSEQSRELIATYDEVNGVTTIVQDAFDPETGARIQEVVAQGTDSGIQKQIVIEGLTNYQDYYFGVQAYAYNQYSTPQMFAGPVTQVTVRPSGVASRQEGTTVLEDSISADFDGELVEGAGQGIFSATIVDPTEVTGDTYRVEFFECNPSGGTGPECTTEEAFTTYNLINATTGETIISGLQYAEERGDPLPQKENVIVADGLAFNVVGPPKTFDDIVEVVDGEVAGSYYFPLQLNPSGQSPRYIPSATGTENASLARALSQTDRFGLIAAGAPRDIELRFVENPETNGQRVFNYFKGPGREFNLMEGWTTIDADSNEVIHDGGRLPFQLWHVFPDGSEQQVEIGVYSTDNDSLWDMTHLFDASTWGLNTPQYEPLYATNQPHLPDLIESDPDSAFARWEGGFPSRMTINRFLIVTLAGDAPPAPGTTIRFVTSKPNLPGDVRVLDVSGYGSETGVDSVATAAVDEIGIVPNPYKGASEYETNALDDVARFINLPQNATINVFTLNGTLVRTLEKRGPSQSLDWDLENDDGLPIASGMYLIHVDTEFGEKVIKFGVVNGRTGIETF